MTFIIQVQHSSDTDLDGKWHDIDEANDVEHAERLLKYFGEAGGGLAQTAPRAV